MASVDVKWPTENEEFDTVETKAAAESEDHQHVEVAHSEEGSSEPSLAPEVSSEEALSDEHEHSEPEAPAEHAPEPAEKPVAQAATPGSHGIVVGKHRGNFGRPALVLLLVLAVVGLAVWGFGLQSKNKDLNSKVDSLQKQVNTLNNNPAIVEQRKTNELVTKVGALMELPKDETPQAALVSDAESLKKQYPFFSSAQNGDQILFYYKAGKVIVYRPSTNKIVQTGPLSITQAATPTASTTKR